MHHEPLFGADFGLTEWLGHTFSKMRPEMQQQWMAYIIATW